MLQKGMTRRDFVKVFGASAAALGLAGGLASCVRKEEVEVEKVLPVLKEIVDGRQPVIWLQASGCTGRCYYCWFAGGPDCVLSGYIY